MGLSWVVPPDLDPVPLPCTVKGSVGAAMLGADYPHRDAAISLLCGDPALFLGDTMKPVISPDFDSVSFPGFVQGLLGPMMLGANHLHWNPTVALLGGDAAFLLRDPPFTSG